MARRKMPLRWLMGGIYFCLMVVLLGGLALYLSHVIAQNYMRTLITTLTGQARLGSDLVAEPVNRYYLETRALTPIAYAHLNAQKKKHIDNLRKSIIHDLLSIYYNMYSSSDVVGQRNGPRRITVLRTDGTRIAETPPNASDTEDGTVDPEVIDAFRKGLGVSIRFSPKAAEELVFIAVPIEYQQSTAPSLKLLLPTTASRPPLRRDAGVLPVTRGILVLATPTADVKGTIGQIQGIILLAFIGGLLILFLLNTAISTFIARPLATLNATAGYFSHGDLHRRVEPTGAYEIANLSESFNSMAEQLQTTIANLDSERAQAQAILASMFDGVIVTDISGRIMLANQSIEQMFDMRASALIGTMLSETTFRFELDDLLQKTFTTGLPLMSQVIFSLPVERNFEVHVAPVEVNSQLLGAVIVLYDITNQRKAEQIQRDFVANVSHELRTPVTSIRAMAETLADGGSDDPQLTEEFLNTIIHESERLTAMLEDLLHLSHLESGRRLINPEYSDLPEIIRHVATRVMAPITDKNQRLLLNIPDELSIYADRNVLVQILVNLLDNARKYSPEGGLITIIAEKTEDRIRIKVIDTGVGIPERELERIFERFYRVDKARSRAAGGTGLGLAIVRHLVELHGGWISVQSEEGKGSTFTVVLPQPQGEPPQPVEAGEPPSDAPMPVAGSDISGE